MLGGGSAPQQHSSRLSCATQSTQEDGTLEHLVADLAVLSCMLVPVSGSQQAAPAAAEEASPSSGSGAGPQPPQPAPVPQPPQPGTQDEHVRECMAESIMVLASTEAGRAALWKVKAPERIRAGYELEEAPAVCRALEAAAELFLSHAEVVDAVGGAVPAAAPAAGGEGNAGQP